MLHQFGVRPVINVGAGLATVWALYERLTALKMAMFAPIASVRIIPALSSVARFDVLKKFESAT
jgi:hypothetical protein